MDDKQARKVPFLFTWLQQNLTPAPDGSSEEPVVSNRAMVLLMVAAALVALLLGFLVGAIPQ